MCCRKKERNRVQIVEGKPQLLCLPGTTVSGRNLPGKTNQITSGNCNAKTSVNNRKQYFDIFL